MTRPDPPDAPAPNPVAARDAGEKGRGVFALRAIRSGQMIETAPALVLSAADARLIRRTALKKYEFEWGREDGDSAIVLGCGSLYNHSYSPNADYYRGYDDRVIHFVAVTDIAAGEQITINYNGFVDDMTGLDFEILP